MTTESDVDPPVNVGQVLAGRFRLEHLLGAGGMGEVYAAKDTLLGRKVAIKVLRHRASASESRNAERLRREAKMTAALTSDHAIRILDVGIAEEAHPFIVMELLSGSDLSELLRKRERLEVSETVDYVLQALEAVAEAHSLGLIHRDLKPSNLFLVDRSGSNFVKVLDFGIAKLAHHEVLTMSLTDTRSYAGSPRYMAPECLLNDDEADSRADIWSTGVILYELLAGRPAFQGQNLAALTYAIVEGRPAPLSEMALGVPRELDEIVQRCLSKEPHMRYSAATLVEALAPYAVSHEAHLAIERVRKMPRLLAPRDSGTWREPRLPAAVKLAARREPGADTTVEAHEPSRAAPDWATVPTSLRAPPSASASPAIHLSKRRWGLLLGLLLMLAAGTAAILFVSFQEEPSPSVAAGVTAPASRPPAADERPEGSPRVEPPPAPLQIQPPAVTASAAPPRSPPPKLPPAPPARTPKQTVSAPPAPAPTRREPPQETSPIDTRW